MSGKLILTNLSYCGYLLQRSKNGVEENLNLKLGKLTLKELIPLLNKMTVDFNVHELVTASMAFEKMGLSQAEYLSLEELFVSRMVHNVPLRAFQGDLLVLLPTFQQMDSKDDLADRPLHVIFVGSKMPEEMWHQLRLLSSWENLQMDPVETGAKIPGTSERRALLDFGLVSLKHRVCTLQKIR